MASRGTSGRRRVHACVCYGPQTDWSGAPTAVVTVSLPFVRVFFAGLYPSLAEGPPSAANSTLSVSPSLLSRATRRPYSPEQIAAWTAQSTVTAIFYIMIPLLYQRYDDPVNNLALAVSRPPACKPSSSMREVSHAGCLPALSVCRCACSRSRRTSRIGRRCVRQQRTDTAAR
jgi:hypothetical protein